jgi:hypothetical protein
MDQPSDGRGGEWGLAAPGQHVVDVVAARSVRALTSWPVVKHRLGRRHIFGDVDISSANGNHRLCWLDAFTRRNVLDVTWIYPYFVNCPMKNNQTTSRLVQDVSRIVHRFTY